MEIEDAIKSIADMKPDRRASFLQYLVYRYLGAASGEEHALEVTNVGRKLGLAYMDASKKIFDEAWSSVPEEKSRGRNEQLAELYVAASHVVSLVSLFPFKKEMKHGLSDDDLFEIALRGYMQALEHVVRSLRPSMSEIVARETASDTLAELRARGFKPS